MAGGHGSINRGRGQPGPYPDAGDDYGHDAMNRMTAPPVVDHRVTCSVVDEGAWVVADEGAWQANADR